MQRNPESGGRHNHKLYMSHGRLPTRPGICALGQYLRSILLSYEIYMKCGNESVDPTETRMLPAHNKLLLIKCTNPVN